MRLIVVATLLTVAVSFFDILSIYPEVFSRCGIVPTEDYIYLCRDIQISV